MGHRLIGPDDPAELFEWMHRLWIPTSMTQRVSWSRRSPVRAEWTRKAITTGADRGEETATSGPASDRPSHHEADGR